MFQKSVRVSVRGRFRIINIINFGISRQQRGININITPALVQIIFYDAHIYNHLLYLLLIKFSY